MSSEVLYRKYRPQSFTDVLGQNHVIEALEGALKLGRISHAYLFSGPRGTGKTSVARILARAIGTKESDLYEIDAASNRGIDDVRALREGVAAVPFESPYKVYIVDEVHMLTKEAFNALLKTLEEPPKHVVFVLATTELEKVPETVQSRCQTFVFKRPSQKVLNEEEMRIAKKEGFSLEPAAAELIALLAEGSYRDAHGILQKAMSASSDKRISQREVERVTGAPTSTLLNSLITALAQRKTGDALGVLAKAAEANTDMKLFAKLFLSRLRFILLLRNAPELSESIATEVSTEDFEFLKKVASTPESNIHSALLLEFLNSYDLIGHAAIPELPLELALIKVCG
jgi:DNA polymerase-3 subunit gamma/tau